MSKKVQNQSDKRKAQVPPLGKLLAWYDENRRVLPWRALPGTQANPYHVMVSEAMLQQTTVATVEPRFRTFIARFPTLAALAEADLDDVLHSWQGLGYYRRARNLHNCAKAIMADHKGRVPSNPDQLRTLPGIGDYSAAAIAAIAFDFPILPVDGNVVRVMSRVLGIDDVPDRARKSITNALIEMAPAARSGDAAQALMELGALVCRPGTPECNACPWSHACFAKAHGKQRTLPQAKAKKVRPECHAIAFALSDDRGRILVRKRPKRGLLAGMIDLPSSDFERMVPPTLDEALSDVLMSGGEHSGEAMLGHAVSWRFLPGQVRHIFTHRALNLSVAAAQVAQSGLVPSGCFWHEIELLDHLALPTLSKKLIHHWQEHR